MAEQKTGNREKVKEIVAGIESGIKDLFQSDRYAEYLRTMSRFHHYSYRNTLLIHSQRPDATLVAGFTKWKNQFQRHVKKGERGMTILAPTPFKKKIEQQKLDPDTHAPVRDEDGNIVTEERTVEIPMFRPVKVFDVKQTDGKPLPSLFMDLTGNVRHYEAFLDALCRTSPVPIDFKPIAENMDGYFSPARQRIAIQDNLSEIQTVCTVVHEITHAVLHNREQDQQAAAAGAEGAEPKKPKDEQTMEVEAESVAYAVCQYYGIETSASSLGYIASWSSGKELPELKASLETISKTADFLITSIDRHFAEICKERGIVLEQTEAFAEDAPAGDMPAEDAPAEDVPAGDIPAATPPVEEESPPPKAEAETRYLYCSEYNPQHVGENDFRFIRARLPGDKGPSPDQILFFGSFDLCDRLLTALVTGKLHHDDFFHVNSARVSRYRMEDGAELDAFVAPDDKVYLGRRDHYDNRGHYLNHDKSLLHVSDNPEMFNFLSGKGYTETQAEMLEEGYFTPEVYAEFAALQADVLAQFEEQEPLLFAGEPFCFIPLDPSEVKLDSSSAQEEALYLVDDTVYLHIRTTEAGYGYTIYDKNTLRDYCGGQIDPLKVDEHFSQGGLRPVVDAILISMPELPGETVEAVPLELLETFHEKAFWKLLESLQEKALPDTQEAAESVQPPRNGTKEPPEHFTGEDAAVLDTALDEYPMPDPAYSKEDAERDFAYLEGYLLPLTKERAEALMEKDFSIYAIVNEYARMVFDREELDQCPSDIPFAISTGEWEESPEFHEAVADRMNHQEEREQAFLRHAGDCFAIYQIKNDDPDRLRFMDMDWLTSKGLTVDRARYELAYTGELACGLGSSALGQLWEKFNIHHPADYHRPSMSVSDIIAVKQDGVISCHYCDSVGFAKVPGFIGGGTKEPTVADLEAQANAGKRISLVDLAGAVQRERDTKKKSVVSQLKEKPAQERRKTRRQKNLENGR
ncbi:YodL domain-containing protein [uncultured Oscillibacter sp.]|uniref:YodL domain-containing protein n=1 Tax=uncultured Oscillibacter sp. TaxID=876091 RepID=UPI0026150578|nr:YodL domain-containing protein [uncultured Oscillibacter sp.]